MPDSNVPITAGSGTLVDTRTNTASEHRQVMVIGEGAALSDLVASFRPDGVLRVANDPTSLLLDTFETLDTVDTWTLSGTVVPTGAAGSLTVSAGTAVSAQSAIRSKAAFTNGAAAFLAYVSAWVLEAGVVTGNKRVWGLGIPNATPTTAVPITNGVVFEIQDTDGALIGAVYSNNVRTATVALTRPTDGAAHRYSIFHRSSRVYYEIDSVVVGSIALPNTQVTALPACAVSVNAAAGAPGTAATLVASVIGVGDTGRNQLAVADGRFPWREASVTDVTTITGALTSSVNERTVGSALNVNPNAIQKATYKVGYLRTTGPAYAAGTIQWHLSLHHLVGSTKTVRIRRITYSHMVPPVATTGVAIRMELHWTSGTPTGTAHAAGVASATQSYKPCDGRTGAGEATVLDIPTITSGGILNTALIPSTAPAQHGGGSGVLYDWQEGGETMPITLRAGVLEGIAIGAISTATVAATANINTIAIEITFTEE